jgi:hypothetical protein
VPGKRWTDCLKGPIQDLFPFNKIKISVTFRNCEPRMRAAPL